MSATRAKITGSRGGVMRCFYLMMAGWSCSQTGKTLYLDYDTIRSWYKKYAEGGFDLMANFDSKGEVSKLAVNEEAALMSWLEERVRQNVHEVRAYIWNCWQVAYKLRRA